MFSQERDSTSAVLPASKTSLSLAPTILKRTVSWRHNQVVQTGLRSGKVNLEKLRRSKSMNEVEDHYKRSVTLESITDLENKTIDENSRASSQLLPQEVP